MIRIKIDIVPYGYEAGTYPIGEVILYNEGTGNNVQGHNYTAYMKTKGRDNEVFKSRVTGFDRNRDVYDLLQLLINERVAIDEEDIDEHIRHRFTHCERNQQG